VLDRALLARKEFLMNDDQSPPQNATEQASGSQSQTLGSMSQQQSQGGKPSTDTQRSAVGPSGHEVPDAQAGYGSSQDEHGESESDQASPDADTAGLAKRDAVTAAEAALGGKAVPGEISPRPDEQARADANPQLYDG
jgi:hypothetical protein